jgi:hypothetical protein
MMRFYGESALGWLVVGLLTPLVVLACLLALCWPQGRAWLRQLDQDVP